MNKKIKNNKIIITIVLILLLITATIGLSYSIFYYKGIGTQKNTISTRTIKCLFNEGIPISIDSAMPISDEVGKKLSVQADENSEFGYKQGYYDTTLSCECKGTCKGTYELYLTNSNTTEDLKIDDEYIKVYVTDGSEIEKELTGVTSFNNLNSSLNNSRAKEIYKGTFSESFSQKIRLRMWIANEYKVSDKSYTFKAKLNAKVSE